MRWAQVSDPRTILQKARPCLMNLKHGTTEFASSKQKRTNPKDVRGSLSVW